MFTEKGWEDVIVSALNWAYTSILSRMVHKNQFITNCQMRLLKLRKAKKAKQLLSESELKYRTVVEKSSQGVLIALANPLRIVFVNMAFSESVGYTIEELLSMSPEAITGLIFKEDRAIFFDRLQKRFQGETEKKVLEFRAVRKDGSIMWVEAFSNPIEYEGQRAVLGMFSDISENKKAYQALKASEEQFGELSNFLPEMIFEDDLTGKVTFVNQKVFDFSGFTKIWEDNITHLSTLCR